ncbi:putative plasmid replication initiator protein [Candidatus Protofrankia californiensis]|uniref:Putative plasmid replication initiator protein n=1 Tax=Candidatus Protofrankia californiensis TaxID=1839754 RepID=A0A1C3P4F3_9ACTN|nr:putative plasmid replication initiator protein [Candidatus Protofrankia californiensis]
MVTDVSGLPGELRDVLGRAADGSLAGLQGQVSGVGGCAAPVRLVGRTREVDRVSGEVREVYSSAGEPDGVAVVRCGNRRAVVCPSCSVLYKGDARQIILTGLVGGSKGVPASVCEHPALFVTFTAPSFGPVHSRRDVAGRGRRCHPRGREGRCPHGLSRSCMVRHDADDPRLGEPICPGCYDYPAHVVFNAVASRLFKRTVDLTYRRLAGLCEVSERALRRAVRITYVRVAEMQVRGVVHFHVLVRMDGAGPPGTFEPPPAWVSLDLLEAAVGQAAGAVRLPCPDPHRRGDGSAVARWGRQVDIRRVHAGDGALSVDQVANYIAKYATKSVTGSGVLDRPIRDRTELAGLGLRPHAQRLIRACWQLAVFSEFAALGLSRWAHSFGYGGHWLTKSRSYSTTFTTLRTTRRRYAKARRFPGGMALDAWGRPEDDEAVIVLRDWRFTGVGWRLEGDRWLALEAAARARGYDTDAAAG